MNLALNLIVQCLALILVITIISQIVGKYLITDYQEDFEK